MSPFTQPSRNPYHQPHQIELQSNLLPQELTSFQNHQYAPSSVMIDQSSSMVGGAQYERISPHDRNKSRNEIEMNGASPLRHKSIGKSPKELSQEMENQERMRKSQERIAAILGIEKGPLGRPAGPARAAPQNQSIQQLLESRRN
mmetsp:Transcript_800/g.1422  ORF Transcript_800/g.1422 Transcript_800/m.1422 type:complete len:145 (+) Transcript_800:136-570(+)